MTILLYLLYFWDVSSGKYINKYSCGVVGVVLSIGEKTLKSLAENVKKTKSQSIKKDLQIFIETNRRN